MPDRDFNKTPYTADEARVAAFISEWLGVGGGDDPIGFVLASWKMMSAERAALAREGEMRKIVDEWIELYRPNGAPPPEGDHSRLHWLLTTMHGIIQYRTTAREGEMRRALEQIETLLLPAKHTNDLSSTGKEIMRVIKAALASSAPSTEHKAKGAD